MTAVTELRTRSEAASRLAEKAVLEDAMEAGLHRLVAVAERLSGSEGGRELSASCRRA